MIDRLLRSGLCRFRPQYRIGSLTAVLLAFACTAPDPDSDIPKRALPTSIGTASSLETEDTLPSALKGIVVEPVEGRTGPGDETFYIAFGPPTGRIISIARSGHERSLLGCEGALPISPNTPVRRATRAKRSSVTGRSATRREFTTTSSPSTQRRRVRNVLPVMRSMMWEPCGSRVAAWHP